MIDLPSMVARWSAAHHGETLSAERVAWLLEDLDAALKEVERLLPIEVAARRVGACAVAQDTTGEDVGREIAEHLVPVLYGGEDGAIQAGIDEGVRVGHMELAGVRDGLPTYRLTEAGRAR